MNQRLQLILERCRRLSESEQTMGDIYRILFSDPDAVMTEDASLVGPDKYRTYGQIQVRAEKIARAILASTEQRQGTFIGLYATNGPQWIELFWGILASGNFPYLINLRQPESVSAQALKTLRASCTVTLGAAPALGTRILFYKDLAEEKDTKISLPPMGNLVALSTNGTSLHPKICLYTGKEFSAQIRNVENLVKENPAIVSEYKGTMKHLAFLPLYHVFGLEAVLLWYSFFGATFVFPPDLSPENLLRTVRYHGVTHVFAVPLLWNAVEKTVRRQVAARGEKTVRRFDLAMKLSLSLQRHFPRLGRLVARRLFREVRQQLFGDSVIFCISGGSYILPETLRFVNGLGYHLCNGYGMSEVGITSVDLSARLEDRLQGTIGRPFASVTYKIDESGHLLIRGDSLCRAVFAEGKAHLTEGWFDTGDLMSADEDGRYSVTGRASDAVFGADGENKNPDLAEKAFRLSHAKNFSVTGDASNENLILIVQIPSDLSREQMQVLEREITEGEASLPEAYKLRKIFYTIDPLMPPGSIKVSRAALRRAVAEGRVRLFSTPVQSVLVPVSEDSPLKRELRKLFSEILALPPEEIPDDAHFMRDLGGSSLDYFTLIGKIDEVFGVTLDYEAEEHFSYSLKDFERIIKEKTQR